MKAEKGNEREMKGKESDTLPVLLMSHQASTLVRRENHKTEATIILLFIAKHATHTSDIAVRHRA